jgi:hypothetical protein
MTSKSNKLYKIMRLNNEFDFTNQIKTTIFAV